MACVCMWFRCALLSVLIIRGKQDAQKLTTPEELKVYPDEDSKDLGVWKMNIEWKDGFPNSITSGKVTYDIQISYTEQKKLVHNETIELKANAMGRYNWSWTSPLPLQCTSHSVRLRYRDGDHTSAWTPLKTLPGKDLPDAKVYPQNHVAVVNESIRFCCILKPEHDKNFNSSDFTIRISNRTYVTKPIRHSDPSPSNGFDIICEDDGSTYYIGYPPDVNNITCETRDLSSVECHWIEPATVQKTPTKYCINRRVCNREPCVLNNYMDTGVVNWTLTATNIFGTTIIFDSADPKHRVHLKAPRLLTATQITASNATLEWRWIRMPKYSSFEMICKVEVNGILIKETFKGTELTSLALEDLKPYTEYKVRLRCGSAEHFYKWGDWSDLITFITKEDIPEAVDLWMQVSGNQTYVVWKNASESNGKTTGYELVIENLTQPNTKHITKSPAELCHKLQADRAKTHHLVSVSAKNSVGVSQPSSITIPNLPPGGGGVNTSVIKGTNKTFHMTWEPSPRSKCGYVLDWYPTYKPHTCAVKWTKISSDHFNATIDSDLKEGVKYTLSVYGCTSGALSLLQRKEGYAVELPPSGRVQNLKAKQEGLNAYLSWENVSEQEQKGFIKGYNVSYRCAGGDEGNVVISDPSTHKYKFSLPVETYTFTVKAFTSAGDGPGAEITLKMDLQDDLANINMVAGLTVLIFVLCIVVVYRNWKWLKSTLWPEIPKPRLSAEFLKKSVHQWQVIDQLLYEETVLKVNRPEICPALIEQEQPKDHEAQDFTHPQSKGLSWSEEYQTSNSNPQAVCLIDVDLSYQELPCPEILNPTYNQSLVPAAENSIVSGYRPQTNNGSVQHQPSTNL